MKTEPNSPAGIGCPAATCSALPPVLDACCGSKAMWFDKGDERAISMDRRSEIIPMKGRSDLVVSPDVIADFTNMPFPDESFSLVVFDPPHIQRSPSGNIPAYYGVLTDGWEEMLQDGFSECFRVLKPHGTLIFKWAETQIPVGKILELTPHKPLFGHKSGKLMKTHWITFLKQNNAISETPKI